MKKRIILFMLLAFVACAVIYLCVKIVPMYRDSKTEAYSILSMTDDYSFVRPGNTTIYASDDSVIGEIGNEQYTYVPISEISDFITNGYIAREDKNFATHSGIDIKAILRASWSYIKNKGVITQGGSTITQQLVKNCLLTSEQTLSRKLTEMLIAIQIERNYSKTQIMEFYCNYNYFGNGCYGVEGASQYYFGKSASSVTLSEAALLVATSNAPSVCNPVADYNSSVEKKNAVLSDMLECEYITQEQYDLAVTENPVIVQNTQNRINNNYLSSYALYCSALKVMESNGFSFKYTFSTKEEETDYLLLYNNAYTEAVEEIYTGGYDIRTSLNVEIQSLLQQSINENLSEFTDKDADGNYKLQSAAVCIDNTSQMVVAIVGGRSGEFNRGFQAQRQPGSAIKPVIDYAPMFNEGTGTPGSVFTDRETTVDGYTPKNSSSSYAGDMTIREALIRSVNTIALQAFETVGQDTAMNYLDSLKFTTLSYADSYAPAISIGGFTNGVSVADMAKAYAVFANNGLYSSNDCVVSMTDYTGTVIYEASDDSEQVYLEDTAFMISDILEGTFFEDYGMARNVNTEGQYYAGKSGTTNNNYDAWFCGYSKYYTTAVWVGFDYPEDLGFYGADYPLDIWITFMNTVHDGLKPLEFVPPETVGLMSSAGETMDVFYDGNVYFSRPAGYDYYSSVLSERAKEAEALREEQKLEEQAEEAVQEFENYQITDTDTAQQFGSAYQSVYDLVSSLKDASVKSSLLERLEYKRDLLADTVVLKWEEVLEDEKEEQIGLQYIENERLAQESLDTAVSRAKTARINLAKEYISALYSCTYYSEHVDNLISYGKEALDKCSEYSEYSSLSSQFNAAASYASSLPEYSNWEGDNIPSPESEESAYESKSVSSDESDLDNNSESSDESEIPEVIIEEPVEEKPVKEESTEESETPMLFE